MELLFDLAFVVAFGTAANELAPALTADHVVAGIVASAFATFGISWAWINFTMAAGGAPVTWCLLVLSLTPWVTVVGYEVRGYRHNEVVLEHLGA